MIKAWKVRHLLHSDRHLFHLWQLHLFLLFPLKAAFAAASCCVTKKAFVKNLPSAAVDESPTILQGLKADKLPLSCTKTNTETLLGSSLLWGQEAFVVQVCWIYTPFTSPFLLLICYLPPPPSHTLYPLLYFFSSVVEWVFREMVECVCWISLHCNPQDCTAPGKDLQCKHTCRWMDNPHSFVP